MSKLVRDNIEMVKVGMTKEAVISLIGRPDKRSFNIGPAYGNAECRWEYASRIFFERFYFVVVIFDKDGLVNGVYVSEK